MTRKALIGSLFLASMLVYAGNLSAACWKITPREGEQIEATEIWNLSSKLEETPQGFLLGRLDGQETQIPVMQVQSVKFESENKSGWRGWLKGSGKSATIEYTDGRQSTLDMELNIFYRTIGEKKHLPASTVMDESSDNSGMDLNIFYRAKGDVKQLPVSELSSIERCNATLETKNRDDIVVQKTGHAKVAPRVTADESEGVDIIGLVNGDQLSGEVTSTPIRWETAYGVLEISRTDIQSLTLDEDPQHDGQVVLRSGDRVSGRLLNKILTIRLSIGQNLDIPVSKLRILKLATPATQR